MTPDFVTIRDADNAQTTLNVKHIILLIIPSALSVNANNLLVFNGGNLKLERDEALRLQSILTDEVKVH